jgi:hypothetical protein
MKKLLALSVIIASSTVHAESLEEKKFWKGQMDYVQRSLDDANKQCGVKFTFDWVDKATLRAETEKTNHSPNGVCSAIIEEVTSICREGEDEKKAVTAKIKGFTCGYAKERKLSLAGGSLKFMGNLEQSNFSDWAKPWLLKNL